MKISRYIVIGTVIYIVVFLVDYLFTLFAIDESGVYKSKLGLKITMDIAGHSWCQAF